MIHRCKPFIACVLLIVLTCFDFPSVLWASELLPPESFRSDDRVCVSKREGCNQCQLEYFAGEFAWSCTELGCPAEPEIPLVQKCSAWKEGSFFKRPWDSSVPDELDESCVEFFDPNKRCTLGLESERGFSWDCEHHQASLDIQMKESSLCLVEHGGQKKLEHQRRFEELKTLWLQAHLIEKEKKQLEENAQTVMQSCYENGEFCSINLIPIKVEKKHLTFQEQKRCRPNHKTMNDQCWNKVIKDQVPYPAFNNLQFSKQLSQYMKAPIVDCVHYENKCLTLRFEYTYQKKWEWVLDEKDCPQRPKTGFWGHPFECLKTLDLF